MNNISTISPLVYINRFFAEFIAECAHHYLEPSTMMEVANEHLYEDIFFNENTRMHVAEHPDGFTWDGMIITDEVLDCLFKTKMTEFYQIGWDQLISLEQSGRVTLIKELYRYNPAILSQYLTSVKEVDLRWYNEALEEVTFALLG